MTEIIKAIVSENAFTIISTLLTIIIVLVIVIWKRIFNKRTYIKWKKETVNLGFWSKTWEVSEDLFIRELWEDNQRLEAENRALKKQTKEKDMRFIISIFVTLIVLYFITLKAKIFKK